MQQELERLEDIRDIQVISLETTTQGTMSQVKKSFMLSESQHAKSKVQTNGKTQNKFSDGKRSVGLKSSMLKKRINQKAMSVKSSVKKILPGELKSGKMSVKAVNPKIMEKMNQLEFNLKSKTNMAAGKASKGKGFITPCKASLK